MQEGTPHRRFIGAVLSAARARADPTLRDASGPTPLHSICMWDGDVTGRKTWAVRHLRKTLVIGKGRIANANNSRL